MKIRALSSLLLVTCTASASPCDGVDRSLSERAKSQLTSVISRNAKIVPAEFLQSYRYRGWHIVNINSYGKDKGLLLFKDAHKQETCLMILGGDVAANEESEIRKVVLKNAKNISSRLVACLEHVTRGRASYTRRVPLL